MDLPPGYAPHSAEDVQAMNDHRHERFFRVLSERLAATERDPSASFGVETADFGTVAGQHTASELQDLLNAKDHDLAELDRIQTDFLSKWQAKDAAAAGDWSKDWAALQGRYKAARAKAVAAITTANAPAVNPILGLAATESAWGSVISALKQAGDPGPMTKGDLQDLANRLSDAGSALNFETPTPQPQAPDADLNTLNALAKADIAGVLTGENKNATAQKIAIGLGIAGGVGLALWLLHVWTKVKR